MKSFYYNWCLTLFCVQGKSIEYRVDQETLKYLIKYDSEDQINRKLYTLISRKKEKLNPLLDELCGRRK